MVGKLRPLEPTYVRQGWARLFFGDRRERRPRESGRHDRDISKADGDEVSTGRRRDGEGRDLSVGLEPVVLEEIPANDAYGKRRLVEPELPGELENQGEKGYSVVNKTGCVERSRVDLIDNDADPSLEPVPVQLTRSAVYGEAVAHADNAYRVEDVFASSAIESAREQGDLMPASRDALQHLMGVNLRAASRRVPQVAPVHHQDGTSLHGLSVHSEMCQTS